MSEENKNEPSYSFWAEQVTSRQTDTSQQANYTNPYPQINITPVVEPEKPKKKSKLRSALFFCCKAAVFGAIAGGVFLGTNYCFNGNAKEAASNKTSVNLNLDPPSGVVIPSTVVSNTTNIKSTDVSEVVAETMPATVAISSTFNTSYNMFGYEYGQETEGGGSGIIIGKNDTQLFIATNNHVVEDATKINVTFIDGTTAEAAIRGRNTAADLAVITLDTDKLSKETLDAIKVAKVGSSDDVKVGQMAIAIGNALGYGQSVTVGYISAKDREITVDSTKKLTLLQTDAAINPGNSGGALINIKGEVIGINSAKLSLTSVEGMGYAIPISSAYPIVDELMNREILTDDEKGYLGLYPRDIDSQTSTYYNWPIGVYVAKLSEGGSAEKAGIYVGDIITAINDITLTTSDQLRETVTSYRYGTTVKVTLMRFSEGEYKEMTIDVVLQKSSDTK